MNDASYLHIDDGFLHWNHLLHYSVGQDGCIESMRMHGEIVIDKGKVLFAAD